MFFFSILSLVVALLVFVSGPPTIRSSSSSVPVPIPPGLTGFGLALVATVLPPPNPVPKPFCRAIDCLVCMGFDSPDGLYTMHNGIMMVQKWGQFWAYVLASNFSYYL